MQDFMELLRNHKRLVLTCIVMSCVIIGGGLFNPLYQRYLEYDHLKTCETVRMILIWEYQYSRADIAKNETEQENDNDGAIFAHVVERTFPEIVLTPDPINGKEIAYSYVLENCCRSGGEVIASIDVNHRITISCDAPNHDTMTPETDIYD